MEAASKKRGRGRPKRFPDELLAVLGDAYPHVTTHRGRQNLAYQARAMSILKGDPAFRWLCDEQADTYRAGLLAELGRIGHPEHMKQAAAWLCEDKPKAKDAIAAIRATRRRAFPQGDVEALMVLICETVDRYRCQHAGIGWPEVFTALDWAAAALAGKAKHDAARHGGEGAGDG